MKIIARIYVNGGETLFNDGDNINDIGKRAHVLKHLHGKCVVGTFDKILHKGSISTGNRYVLSFILQISICIHFVHNGIIFYDKYISSDLKNKHIDDEGSGVFTKTKG